MDAGTVQGLRDRDARPDARERHPRPRRPATSTASDASDGQGDAAAVIPAAPARRKLDVIA